MYRLVWSIFAYDVTQDADMWSDALRIVKEYLPHKVNCQLALM